MNHTALKKFAANARKELFERIEMKVRMLGITEENIASVTIESSDALFIGEKQLLDDERKQRYRLIQRMKDKGFSQVIKEAAYTYFNRFVALRFMEVNEYLPTHTRVLSSHEAGETIPDMIREALHLDLPLDREYVYNLRLANDLDQLFAYLIKAHCHELHQYMPFIFSEGSDPFYLLFPDGLLSQDSFLRQMTDPSFIPEEDWKQVEIIGWLYQYYISEENDRVIRAKRRYLKEEIPYATQLFTPKWIVQYMVQNTLGRFWIHSHPEDRELIKAWEYYLESRDQSKEMAHKFTSSIDPEVKIEEIKCFDPAMGSGHILLDLFDMLYEIYQQCGYMEHEIPRLIFEKNLYGLDIDDRAYQLACFSLMMKALQYDPYFLQRVKNDRLQLNITSIQETNGITEEDLIYLAGESSGSAYNKMKQFITQFEDAKAIGSILQIKTFDREFLQERLHTLKKDEHHLLTYEKFERMIPLLEQLVQQAELMTKTYDIFITNPPYMNRRYFAPELLAYVDKHYPKVKTDLFACFIELSWERTKSHGHIGMMTPYVWMFITSFQNLRKQLIEGRTITSLIQLEYSGFDGATVPICTFTFQNDRYEISGEYVRLTSFKGAKNQPIYARKAAKNPKVPYRFTTDQRNFLKLPRHLLAYWASQSTTQAFEQGTPLQKMMKCCTGMQTGNNARYMRYWYEVPLAETNIQDEKGKWRKYNCGGDSRKWYGNHTYVLLWGDNGEKIRKEKSAVIRNEDYFFKEGISWKRIGSSASYFRYLPEGFIFDQSGDSMFPYDRNNLMLILALLNSKVASVFFEMIAPTLNLTAGNLNYFPVVMDGDRGNDIEQYVRENISIAKEDWDAFETSWDFKKHPFLKKNVSFIGDAFQAWREKAEGRFQRMKNNEEALNQRFIETYKLEAEMNPEVEEDEITLRKADRERDVKSFLSYAIGCMFGRYSLDEEGLIHAGGPFNQERYARFPAEKDNFIPMIDENIFENDIVERLEQFLMEVFGKKSLEQNLEWIAESLNRRQTETARETLRRYFIHHFAKDHSQMYKKHPIYWVITSGKEKAFHGLIYYHRLDERTIVKIRTEYVQPLFQRYEVMKSEYEQALMEDSLSAREIQRFERDLRTLDKKERELHQFDEKLHHIIEQQITIDADDGIRTNYERFKDILIKI